MSEKGVALFGPWIGEFGWELMTWQAWCRKQVKNFDKVYVCSFPDMEPLYRDFAEFIPHDHKGRALDWDKKENIDKVNFERPEDVTAQILPFKRYKTEGDFIKFGFPIEGYSYLLHARGIGRGGKDYPLSEWIRVSESLEGTVASIGSELDHHIPGTADMRGIPLNDLMDIMAGCNCVIGQSSGVMHLACLCGARVVVWGDGRTYFGETLVKRYTETWNPFKVPVSFIVDDKWKPDYQRIVTAACVEQAEKEDMGFPEPEPEEMSPALKNHLTQALKLGRYFITISTIQKGKLYHYYNTFDFPKTDLLPSLTHLSNQIKEREFKEDKKQKGPQLIDKESNTNTGVDTWT